MLRQDLAGGERPVGTELADGNDALAFAEQVRRDTGECDLDVSIAVVHHGEHHGRAIRRIG
jgi:hypothetical protein